MTAAKSKSYDINFHTLKIESLVTIFLVKARDLLSGHLAYN